MTSWRFLAFLDSSSTLIAILVISSGDPQSAKSGLRVVFIRVLAAWYAEPTDSSDVLSFALGVLVFDGFLGRSSSFGLTLGDLLR